MINIPTLFRAIIIKKEDTGSEMKKSVKALSVLLILAALFGLLSSGLTLRDALTGKDYWSEKGKITDENLAKLEDGLNQLGENEQTYLDGRALLEQGKKDFAAGKDALAKGKAEYEAGKKLLTEKQGEYDAGVAKLAAAE